MNQKLYKVILKSLMEISYRVPFLKGRVGHSLYPYMFRPQQLMFIAEKALEAHRNNPKGSFVEAGCAYGATTIFINKLIRGLQYHALDTFSGFTMDSIEHESVKRGKNLTKLKNDFTVNKKEWYLSNLSFHGISNVNAIQSDVALVDYSALGPIAFCLLDVDLYLPIAACLPMIYKNLAPGGIIIIDDCQPNHVYDGADQAFREFCEKENFTYRVVEGKLGVLEKPL